MKYIAVIGKTGNGYSAHLPDLPGCIAAIEVDVPIPGMTGEIAVETGG